MRPAVLIAAALLLAGPVSAQSDASFLAQSGPGRVSLVELYSSEDCSACPPAEEWISKFAGDERRLWKEYAPAVFHVDYWDKLGWKDVYARREYTERQRAYAQAWAKTEMGTPGVVLDGLEWKKWFVAQRIPDPPRGDAGMLRVYRRPGGEKFTATYVEPRLKGGVYVLHAALLGFGVTSEVEKGENAGRTLTHDFLVIDYKHVILRQSPKNRFVNDVHLRSDVRTSRRAVVFWITLEGWTDPRQVAGAWIG